MVDVERLVEVKFVSDVVPSDAEVIVAWFSVAFVAKRFVDDAVVAKEFVLVALVLVELSAVKF